MSTFYALIEPSGRVADVVTQTFPVAVPFEWVECSSEVKTDWSYVDGEFSSEDIRVRT